MSRSAASPDPQAAGRSRGERLIVACRAVLAAASLIAIWFDPSSPGKHAGIAYALLAGYLAYAVILVPVAWRFPLSMRRAGVLTHSADLCAFTFFMYFTEGATSPFFVYLVFGVLAGAVRWQWRGALWTGLAATAVFVGMGVYVGYALQDPAFELNRFIIRGVYLILVTVLLGYLTAYEQGLRAELVRIAAWPRTLPPTTQALVRQELEHAGRLLNASRVMMVWEDTEEPWTYLARMEAGELVLERRPPPTGDCVVASALADVHFYCADLRSRPTLVHTVGSSTPQPWPGDLLDPRLVARYGMIAVLALRVAGDRLDGRLLALDPRGRPEDLLTLGEVLAHLVEADLDRFHLQERLVEAAAAEERVRLARDLHDGLLQSMTATGLQLEGVLRSLERDPVAARKRLEEVQALVAIQQADLRNFVQQLRVLPLSESISVPGTDMRLAGLAHRVADQWGIRVELTQDNPHRPIGDDLGREIYHIVQECIANAARHGAATEVKIRIGSRDDRIRVEVADNGRGFPFSGRHDLAALTASGIGPLSLRQRIANLGGELVVDSGKNGARLEIELPA